MENIFAHTVRQLRQARQLTLEQLAKTSGVSRAALSKIERAERSPSLTNALQIAEALHVPLAELIGQPLESVAVTRAGQTASMRQNETRVLREAVLHPYRGTEVVRYTLARGEVAGPFPAHETGTREAFIVLSGQIEIQSGSHRVALAVDDAAAIPADCVHTIVNTGDIEARYLLLIGRP